MNMDIQTLAIVAVFLSQILLLSFVAPIRLRRFSAQQYDSHPETEYPRWYPVSRSELERLVGRHVVARMIVGLIGMAVLLVGIVLAVSPLSLAAALLIFLVLQLWSGEFAWMPGMRRVLRALREIPPPVRRSATLRRWRITDFVSPAIILLGFASQLSVVAAGVYAFLEGRSSARPVIVIGLAAAIWIIARMVHRILKPAPPARVDPSMSDADVQRLRQLELQEQFWRAAAEGLVLSLLMLVVSGILGINPVWICLALSLLVQTRSLLSPNRLFRFVRSMDASAYRAS